MLEKKDSFYSKLSTDKSQKILLVIISAVIFVLIYMLNYMYPIFSDDWHYSFFYKYPAWSEPIRRITNISELFESQYNHYMQWGGRTIAHTIDQILLIMSPFWQDLLNSLAYVALMFVLYKIANVQNKIQASVLLLTCTLFWLFQPHIASTALWITGSANYLWCGLIIAIFLYPFVSFFIKGDSKKKNTIFKSILILLGGIIAGWTNENTVCGILFIIVSIIIISKKQKNVIPQWVYWGLAGCFIGFLLMMLCPGNYHRTPIELSEQGLAGKDFISHDYLGVRLKTMWRYYYKYLLVLIVPNIIFIFYFFKKGTHLQKNKIMPLMILLLIAAHGAFFAMMFPPIFPVRAMFGLIMMLILSLALAYANLNLQSIKSQKVIVVLFSLLIISATIDYIYKFSKIHVIYKVMKERDTAVAEGKKHGVKDYIFTNKIKKVSRSLFFIEGTEDPKSYFNQGYAKYHRLNSVIILSPEKKDSIDSIQSKQK